MQPVIPPPLSSSPHGIPTPPDYPRKRRNFLRDSEDTDGDLSIEDYLYRCDPYRSTTLEEPWPYPLTYQQAPVHITQRVEACRQEFLEILSDHNFPAEDSLRFRVSNVTKPEYPGGDQPITVLRLAYISAPYAPKRLGPARDEIHRLMTLKGIDDVHVEIVFLDMCFRPSLFSISKDDMATAAYETAKRSIMQFINSELPMNTSSIVIFVKPFSVADWSTLVSKVKRLLPSNVNPASINVKFLPGKIDILAPADTEDGGLSLHSVMREDGVPVAGTSIGVLPERGGGSLGPFVTVCYQGSKRKAALTNFHVSARQEIQEQAARFGSPFLYPDSTNVDVTYFAMKDRNATASSLESLIGETRTMLRNQKEEKEEREVAGMRIPPSINAMIDTYEREIESYERKRAIVQSMPLRLGEVLASSGRRIVDNRIADWAIITLDPEPFQSNAANFFNRMPHVPLADGPWTNTVSNIPVLPEGTVLDRFGALEKEEWYCKVGRSTHLTAGMCNGTSAYCNWPVDSRRRYDGTGQSVSISDGITEEWVITSECLGSGGKKQGDFCERGDSGSGIIHRTGKICGLLYGSAGGLCGHSISQRSGLCSTMTDVRKWIEWKTAPKDSQGNRTGSGATLELPLEP